MKTKDLQKTFEEILKTYQLKDTQIYIVPSVKDWEDIHLPVSKRDNNPFRIAVAARRTNSDIRDIVLKEEINEDDIKGVTSAMDFKGFNHCKELEKDLRKFILHTFLHEVAHATRINGELNCDNWAYDELQKFV